MSILAALAFATSSQAQESPLSATPQPRPFEAEIMAFAVADAAAPPPPCATLFVGSSSIRLWTSLAEDFPDRRVINRGFGGSTIADSVRYFDRIAAPYAPRAIVFYAGENDLAQGKSPPEVFSEFKELLTLKRELLGNTPLWFVSLKPSPARWSMREQQIALNAMVADLANETDDLAFIDVASPMLTPSGKLKDIYAADGLHMHQTGYRIWTALIGAALQELPPTAYCP